MFGDLEMSTVKKKPCSSLMMMSLPEEIIVDIIARVPRCYYLTLSLVSKSFRSLVTSPELYSRRSLLGCTEHCLYVVLYNDDTDEGRFYILQRTANSIRLVLVPSLPSFPDDARFIADGSKIYLFGLISTLYMDCRSHTVHVNPLPSLPMQVPESMCDMDDILYFYDTFCSELKEYDRKQMCWKVVKVVRKELLPKADYYKCLSHTVSCGGRLFVFLSYRRNLTREIWCAEIALERSQECEISGKVEWCDIVVKGKYTIMQSLVVML